MGRQFIYNSGFTLVLIWLLASHSISSSAQTFIPGVSVLDATGYVEYIPGNLPVVLSAPHGGYLEPTSIPDRDCVGCVYIRDAYTQELSRSIVDDFEEETGCYPHLIINLLHRKKFDANRSIETAADSNLIVEQAWHAYHEFIDSAKAKVIHDFGKGLFLDLHGHGHTIQRIEVGYTLTSTELQQPDSVINTVPYVDDSSIRSLVNDNLQALTHAELLRGPESFGTLLANKGVPAVPSVQDPFPGPSDLYFTGGYNTDRHGSENGGNIDAIQLECHQTVRFDSTIRENFADSLTGVINEFIALHYLDQYLQGFCSTLTEIPDEGFGRDVEVYPNPVGHYLHFSASLQGSDIVVYNLMGEIVRSEKAENPQLDVQVMDPGIYFIEFRKQGTSMGIRRFVKL